MRLTVVMSVKESPVPDGVYDLTLRFFSEKDETTPLLETQPRAVTFFSGIGVVGIHDEDDRQPPTGPSYFEVSTNEAVSERVLVDLPPPDPNAWLTDTRATVEVPFPVELAPREWLKKERSLGRPFELVSTIWTSQPPHSIKVSEGIAFVGTYHQDPTMPQDPRLEIFDVLDPANPGVVGSVSTGAQGLTPKWLAVARPLVFVAHVGPPGFLSIVDVGDLNQPRLLETLSLPNFAPISPSATIMFTPARSKRPTSSTFESRQGRKSSEGWMLTRT